MTDYHPSLAPPYPEGRQTGQFETLEFTIMFLNPSLPSSLCIGAVGIIVNFMTKIYLYAISESEDMIGSLANWKGICGNLRLGG